LAFGSKVEWLAWLKRKVRNFFHRLPFFIDDTHLRHRPAFHRYLLRMRGRGLPKNDERPVRVQTATVTARDAAGTLISWELSFAKR